MISEHILKKIHSIKLDVLKEITPTKRDLEDEENVSQRLINKIKAIEGKQVDVLLAGSVARNTHVRGDKDLDVFVLFPTKMRRAEFEKEGLRIAKQCLKGHEFEEAFSEHPYIKGKFLGFEVEIVPSYQINKISQKKSSVDRTPLHNDYLMGKLNGDLRKEIRLMKKFLKGIRCYGSDLKFKGFSGYLTELLTLHYGNFEKTLDNASKWNLPIVLDEKKHYHSEDKEKLVRKFSSKFIVIDPVDKNRNVAAALSEHQLERFILAAKLFLLAPKKEFFDENYPQPYSLEKIKKELEKRNLMAVKIARPIVLEDILWGQLRRWEGRLKTGLEKKQFRIERSDLWVGERDCVALFELKALELPTLMTRMGPLATDTSNVAKFLKANEKILLGGPRIESKHIIIDVKREEISAEKSLKKIVDKTMDGSFQKLEKELGKAEVWNEKHLMVEARKKNDFRLFLTIHFKGLESFY